MDHHVGAVERAAAGHGVAQVVVGGADDPHVGAEVRQPFDRRRAEKSRATRDGHGPAAPELRVRRRAGHPVEA
jgi:hypothetical protein